MSGYLTPMLLVTGVAAANDWYNASGDPTAMIKPLVMGGIATGILGIISSAPGMAQVATGVAWVAFAGYMIAGGAGKGTPVGNILAITGTG